MTSNHHAPQRPGLGHTCYNGVNKGSRAARSSKSQKITSQFGFSLQLTMKLESLVIADQNAAVNTFPVLYTPPVTPWESVTPEVGDPTEGGSCEGGPITGVKS